MNDDNEYYRSRAAELGAMLEIISDAVYIGNANGITLANQAALDQLGVTTHKELNRHIGTLAAEINPRDIQTGEVIPAERQAFARALNGERVTQDVLVRDRLSGKELILRCATAPVMLDGKIISAISVNTNITERHKAEATLRDNDARKAFLLKLKDVIKPLSDPLTIQEEVTHLLGEHLGVDRTYYVWTNEQRQVATVERDYVRGGASSLVGEHPMSAFESMLKMIRAGLPFIASDVLAAYELRLDLDIYLKFQLRAFVSIPLIKDNKLIAAMCITSAIPRKWTSSDISLLEETAERTWAAVERARAEDALRKSEERQTFLLELSDALRPLSNSVAIEEATTRLVGEHLGAGRAYYARCNEAQHIAIIERDYFRSGSVSLAGVHHYADFGEIVKVIRLGRAFVVNDVLLKPEVQPQLENYLTIGLRAVLAIPLIKGGEMVACMAVTDSVSRSWTQNEILLLEEIAERTWAAVERGRVEEALLESENKFRKIIEQAPVAMAIYTGPEFIIETYNDKVLEFWGRTAEQVKNKPLFEALPEASNQGFEQLLTNVLHTGETLNANELPVKLLRNGILETTWINFIYEPVKDIRGSITGVMVVCNEVTELVNARAKIEEAEERSRLAIEAADLGTFDFNLETHQLITSARFDELFGITQPVCYETFITLVHPDDRNKAMQAIEDAFKTGKLHYEGRIIKKGTIGWVQVDSKVYYNKEGQPSRLLGGMLDITLRKTAEQQLQNFTTHLEQEVHERTLQLQESRDRLQSVWDTTLMQMSILQAVRNESGEIQDFEIKLVNKELERETRRNDLVGKVYTHEYPGIRQTKLFDLIVDTTQTGKPNQIEYYYPHEGFDKWYSCMFVKLNDGVVATNMDITTRKRAEQEQFKNYTLLQQSEDLALLGSWDFDSLSGVFTWSDGMYRLFELEKQTEVVPEMYLRYSTEAGREAAQRIVRRIRQGDTDFTETLEIKTAGRMKLLHLKAAVIRNDQGQPVRVLGVDMDITAARAADEKIKRMIAEQQQEIFQVTLVSQEEERRRISESLHNGLGQLLYAIKISMAHVTRQQAISNPEAYAEAKIYTEILLKDAINEARRISHELMPSVLEDFGLEAAINDICQQLSSSMKFQFFFTGLSTRLDKYMELAVYRTVQELMLNVVKHSGATQASAEVIISKAKVLIKVQDNGKGISKQNTNKAGIGLASIRSKVRLLNGQIKIDSPPKLGTTVIVHIPLPSVRN